MRQLHDVWLILHRQLTKRLRTPAWIIFGMIQPLLYLALFGPLASRAAANSLADSGDGWTTYVPGLLVQLAIVGTSYAGFGLIGEWRLGILDRMRVTPVSRLALLMGRVLCDAVVLLVQALLIVVVGTLFGLNVSILGILLAFLFVLLVGIGIASLSYSAALWVKSEDAYAPLLSMVIVPVMLLSGVLLPMQFAPYWLDVLSRCNPLRHVVDAMRAAFNSDYSLFGIAPGIVAAIGLVIVSVAVGTRTFLRENA